MPKIVAIYGSPRRTGNTAALLDHSVQGAQDAGAVVKRIVLRDLKMSPCLEIYGCQQSGNCAIQDDFQSARDQILSADGLMVASPVFFYAVSAHIKILMDRCQSLWVRKYWIDKTPVGQQTPKRKGLFIGVGATRGKRLFEGILLSVQYWFDVLDAALWKSLLFRELDFQTVSH